MSEPTTEAEERFTSFIAAIEADARLQRDIDMVNANVTATLDALAAKVATMWLGVELLAVGAGDCTVTFPEPMVSASDARNAVLALIAEEKRIK